MVEMNMTEVNLLKGKSEEILECDIVDETGLNDFQKLPNKHGVAIPSVGIERFRIPLKFRHSDGEILNHDCEASMSVYLAADKTGVNMSRFCAILQEEANKMVVDKSFFKKILGRYRVDLRDEISESPIEKSFFDLKFNYPLKQQSLKSENWGWQYYSCEILGVENKDEKVELRLVVNYEYSSTCPCSLSMSKQYEQDYREGKTTLGNGIATAHSQRSNARVEASIDLASEFFIEDLIELLRMAIPTETQSLVKRADEQAFAILNGENPVFVEHVARRLSKTLDQRSEIIDWNAKIEHFESLHSHNAVAYIEKVLQ
jgi:GTP cyclohydrolase I